MAKITILTDSRYLEPRPADAYVSNIFLEYGFLKKELESRGLKVDRIAWDDPHYDWSETKAVIFRTVWDYFERFQEFMHWLESIRGKTILINSEALVRWNIDKHYLADLEKEEIDIIPTVFVDRNRHRSLVSVCKEQNWKDVVIKPAVSGAAYHTYMIPQDEIESFEEKFKKLVSERDMLIQPYIPTITSKGEASLMVFNGLYTHAVLKKAKPGDFRVQDDFGGTVHHYDPSSKEIAFAEAAFAACPELPAYGRADIVWDESGNPLLSELEIFEPELWLRFNPEAAKPFADGILKYIDQ